MKYNGLSDKEVIEKRKKYGDNGLSRKKQDTFFKMFVETLGDPIIKILLIALSIKIIFLFKDFDFYETIGIVLAIIIASFISTISEYGSEKAFERLQEESSKIRVRVIRNSKVVLVDVSDIVLDDIVLLSSGDKVPADGIVLEGTISLDESSLNGEAKEVYKSSSSTSNKVYRGTVVYDGEALIRVDAVGDKTFYGNLASEIQDKEPISPLKLRLTKLAKTISIFGYIFAILVALGYLFSVVFIENNFDIDKIVATISNGRVMFGHILYALTLSVTLIVVSVPEGLPMMITLVLSSNMRRMLKKNVLVRKLVGIETAGSLNILFTDKTGTLTKGKLEVIGLYLPNKVFINNVMELSSYRNYYDLVIPSLLYNNDSVYDFDNNRVIGGNITDRAIMDFIKMKKGDEYKITDKVSFDSKNKYMISVVKGANNLRLIKGAPEVIINACNTYYDANGDKKIFKNKDEMFKKVDDYTKNGIRVLALAVSDDVLNLRSFRNVSFLGLVMIKDEVRKEAISGLEMVKAAGIQTVMVTGDNKNTASALAFELGLLSNDDDIILTSDELAKMSDKDVKKILPKLKVVARSLPHDKSRLVNVARDLDLVVGMTGDGVNDAPALKKADVGFAMGSGTEVAKEASNIVILDDNFMSIVNAILFGRTIFKSIRKFIIFQLSVNICAVMVSLIGPFIGIDQPVTVIQMLWINMVMDTLAGVAFAYEPPLIEYMNEKPKKKGEHIVNKYMFNQIIVMGLYTSLLCLLFLKLPSISNLFEQNGGHLMTAFFGLFIFCSIFNSFNARTHRINIFSNIFKNKAFLIVILFIVIIQIYLIYYGGEVFRTVGLSLYEFNMMILISMTVIPVDFLRKVLLRLRGIKGGV
ncbi:MAG: calcium-translocating P-type ATPase, PMCA-type [Bacilli bacterium]